MIQIELSDKDLKAIIHFLKVKIDKKERRWKKEEPIRRSKGIIPFGPRRDAAAYQIDCEKTLLRHLEKYLGS